MGDDGGVEVAAGEGEIAEVLVAEDGGEAGFEVAGFAASALDLEGAGHVHVGTEEGEDALAVGQEGAAVETLFPDVGQGAEKEGEIEASADAEVEFLDLLGLIVGVIDADAVAAGRQEESGVVTSGIGEGGEGGIGGGGVSDGEACGETLSRTGIEHPSRDQALGGLSPE